MTRVITSRPTDSADSTRPQPRTPKVSRARAGPRVNQAPAWIAFITPKPATTTHSQVFPVNTDQPSRRSRSMLASRLSVRAGRLTRVSSSAAASQLTASKASAQPEPTPATSKAATVGPTTVSPARENESSAFACWRWERGAICGTMPSIAGIVNADTVPLAASSATSIQSSACPLMTR
jgi:hypothetical protein